MALYKMTKVMILLVILIYGCSDIKTNGNTPPSISYQGIDKDFMNQGFTGDSIVVSLKFEDLDGDIVGGNTAFNISIIDNRDGTADIVSFPRLPSVGDTQKGDMELIILTTCCINPNNAPCEPDTVNTTNTYTYDIFIEDSAGNESNRITTDLITLHCN